MASLKELETLAYRYQVTMLNSDFNKFIKSYNPYIHKTINNKKRLNIDISVDHDDLYQEGLIAIANHFKKYTYICNHCNYKTENKLKFSIHSKKYHNSDPIPYIGIIKFINYNLGVYISNSAKKSVSKRTMMYVNAIRDSSINADDESYSVFDSIEDNSSDMSIVEDKLFFNDLIEKTSLILKSRTKYVLDMFLSGYTYSEVSTYFANTYNINLYKAEKIINLELEEINKKASSILSEKEIKCKCNLICLDYKSFKSHYNKRHA